MRTITSILTLILVFLIPWENIAALSGIGTLTRLFGIFAFGAWLVLALTAQRFRKPHWFHIVVYLFVLWNIASTFWTTSLDATTERTKTYAQLAIMVWILWDLLTTPKALNAALQAYVLGAFVSITSTISNYLAGQEAYAYSGGRFAATGFNANDLSLIVALGIPIAWHLAISEGEGRVDQWLRLVNYIYIPLAIWTILLTASRGSLLAVVPALFFILFTLGRLRLNLRVLVLVMGIVVIFVVLSLVPQSAIQRLATTGDSIIEGDLGGRVYIWRAGITTFLENPVLGVGSGGFREAVGIGTGAHNIFLSVLTETGLIGLALFALMLGIAIYAAMRQTKWYGLLWLTVLAVWAIGAFAHSWEYRKPTWLILILVIISGSLNDSHESVIEVSQSPNEQIGQQAVLAISGDTSTKIHIRK